LPQRERKKISERELISWIRGRGRSGGELLEIGPGDDAALLRLPSRRLVATIDTIAEGVDFFLDETTPEQVGRKALAANLSDLAAMGARPLFCLVSVALREGLGRDFARGLYRGVEKLAEKYDCAVAGGDVTGWEGGLVLTIAAAGTPAAKRALTRSGARPGEALLVTGRLGGSILGKHFTFTPRIEEAAWLAENLPVGAMIDISDGLGVDAGHVAAESRVRLSIDAAKVPVSRPARRLAERTGKSPLEHAVSDGEDFELLFTLPEPEAARCIEQRPFRTRITRIGRVEEGEGVELRLADGTTRRIEREGYEHLG